MMISRATRAAMEHERDTRADNDAPAFIRLPSVLYYAVLETADSVYDSHPVLRHYTKIPQYTTPKEP